MLEKLMDAMKNSITLEDLKKAYRQAAMNCHPDKGGSDEDMKKINSLYTKLFKKVSSIHKNKDGELYNKPAQETPQEFINIINELLKLEGIEIEVIGSFIWVEGETKPHKDTLKKLGFRWHSKKLCWYKAPQGYRKKTRHNISMDEIREMYGVRYTAKTEDVKQLMLA